MRIHPFFCAAASLFLVSCCLLAGCSQDPAHTQDPAVTACDAHTPGDWITVTEADEDTEGLKKRLCTRCGEALESERIPATGSEGLEFYSVGETAYGVKAKDAAAITEHIIIPATHQGKPVVEIASEGFGSKNADGRPACPAPKRITLPDSITAIGAYAFAGCEALESINLPEGLTRLGQGAFDGCKSLANPKLPTTLSRIDTHAFRGCTSITALSLPQGITEIGQGAFQNCTGLAKLSLPAGLLRIENAAFADCDALTEVALPQGLTTLGASVFSDCDSLTKLTLPSSLTEVGGRIAYGCEKLSYTLYDGGKYLGNEQEPFLVLEELSNKTASFYAVHSGTKLICALALDTGLLQSVILPQTLCAIGIHTLPLTYYYAGSAADWAQVLLTDQALYGDYIPTENLYFYSDDPPAEQGNYWHYVTGLPTKW